MEGDDAALVAAMQGRFVLAGLRCHILGATRVDRKADVGEDGARVVASRIPGAEAYHRAVLNAQNKGRQALERLSMPYGDESGWRLLPFSRFEQAVDGVTAAKRDFDAAVAEVATHADRIVETARKNAARSDVDVPTREELTTAYGMRLRFEPLPRADFFPETLPPPARERLVRAVERNLVSAYRVASLDVGYRLLPRVRRLVDGLERYEVRVAGREGGDRPRDGTFRDTLVGNVAEIADLLPEFDLGDRRMSALVASLHPFTKYEARALRHDSVLRREAANRARAIMGELEAWLAR